MDIAERNPPRLRHNADAGRNHDPAEIAEAVSRQAGAAPGSAEPAKTLAARGSVGMEEVPRSAPRPECPVCKGSLYRVPRRFLDRVLSVFVPVCRYRCHSWACGWEGNLRASGDSPSRASGTGVYGGRGRKLEPSRMKPPRPPDERADTGAQAPDNLNSMTTSSSTASRPPRTE